MRTLCDLDQWVPIGLIDGKPQAPVSAQHYGF